MPDVWRAELPGMLWGWKRISPTWQPQRVRYKPVPEYGTCQATLTRALASLYDKGLIRFSYAWHGWQEPIYALKGANGKAKSVRLTPLGTEIAFLRIPWKPRPPSTHLTPVYGVKSITTTRQRDKNGYTWIDVN
jgi:hypothetical protein